MIVFAASASSVRSTCEHFCFSCWVCWFRRFKMLLMRSRLPAVSIGCARPRAHFHTNLCFTPPRLRNRSALFSEPLRQAVIASAVPSPDHTGQRAEDPAGLAAPSSRTWLERAKKPIFLALGAVVAGIAVAMAMGAQPALAGTTASSSITTGDWIGERMLYYLGKAS